MAEGLQPHASASVAPGDIDPLHDTPYPSDIAFLEDQLRRLELLIDLRMTQREDQRTGGPQGTSHRSQELKARLERMEDIIARRVSRNREEQRPLALDRTAEQYGLSSVECDLLLLALAPTLDLHFADLYDRIAYKYRGRTVDTALTILCDTLAAKVEARRLFMLDAPLIRHHLVLVEQDRWRGEEDVLSLELRLPRRVMNLLLGSDALDESLVTFSKIVDPTIPLDQVVLPDAVKSRAVRMVEHHDDYLRRRKEWGFDRVIGYGRGVVLLFAGPPGTGKTMLANALARHIGKRLLLVNTDRLYDRVHTLESNIENVFREARLQNCVLFFDECEMLFADRRMGNGGVADLLTALERFDGIAILATNLAPTLDSAMDRRILLRVDFEVPGPELRERIWRNHLPAEAPLADDLNLGALAHTFEFTGGYIKNAVLTALHEVLGRREAEPRIGQTDLEQACRAQLRQKLGAWTDRITPRVPLANVVLPPGLEATVRELIDAVRHRTMLFVDWGLGERLSIGRGVTALFQGPPGTGKTLTAEAVGYELAKTIYQVSLPAVVSKYVGETEKNLRAVFDAARESESILFFDEADALFGRRTQVTAALDRYANMEVNLLLQEIERFDGLIILATNLVGNLDEAFERRLAFRLRFPFPDAASRAAIWRSLIPPRMPAEPVDFEYLGSRFDLSGGHIKNAVLRAAYRVAREKPERRRLTTAHLVRAAEEEVGGAFERRGRLGFQSEAVRRTGTDA